MTISKKGGRFSVAKTSNPLTKKNERWMKVKNGKGVSEDDTTAGVEKRPEAVDPETGSGMDIDSSSDDGYEDTKMDDTEEQAFDAVKGR